MHPDELNVFDENAQESLYHPTEKSGYSFADKYTPEQKEECEVVDGAVLADTRFEELLKFDTLPNEFDVQQKSGVWDTLQALPHYNELVPNA